MFTRLLLRPCFWVLALSFLADAKAVPPAPNVAALTSLRFTVRKRSVTALLEPGLQQVVLEQKYGSGWKPLAVTYPLPYGPRVSVFNLATEVPASELRVQGYRKAKFPARFKSGIRNFDRPDPSVDLTSGQLTLMPTINFTSGVVVNGMRSADMPQALAAGALTSAPLPEAVESDIWQIVGSRVYFFNQYRGLQILDVSDPTQPARLGSLRLPASGEQMFVLNPEGSRIALLGRSNDKTRAGAATIWLIEVTEGVPVLVNEVPLEGAISDSRLIGDRLHVLCTQVVLNKEGQPTDNEVLLTSLEVSNLETPRKLGTLRFPVSVSGVLQAAGGQLLIATQSYASGQLETNAVHLVDASDAPRVVKTFKPKGVVQDKFKMSIVGDAVVVVSLFNNGNWNNRSTWVETFPLSGGSVSALASLELEGARGETLHATRFDGSRLYVVTFRQVDPLFVVDLADPAAPVLSGTLEIPGWSTYLEPLGNRLLAVGVEAGQVTVSLFDVTDVSAPSLLSRLHLGEPGVSSWSEANYDEKAVEYLPEQGLVMVPFQTWWGSSGPQKAIQVVGVAEDDLTAGPTLEHDFNPRRGSFIADHFVSISGQELLVHSAGPESATEPVVRLPLAWRTDRVLPVGDWLVQIEDGPSVWRSRYGFNFIRFDGHQGRATLRVTSAQDPDALQQVLDLGEGQIVGLTSRGNRLFLAQHQAEATERGHGLRTLEVNLASSPPVVAESGSVVHDLSAVSSYDLQLDRLQPLWVTDQKLVWYVPMQPAFNWWGPIFIQPVIIGPITLQPIIARPIILQGTLNGTSTPVTGGTIVAPPPAGPVLTLTVPAAALCPVSVSDSGILADPPQVVRVKEGSRGASRAFAQDGFLFMSYDTSKAQPPVIKPAKPATNLRVLALKPALLTSWLQVIDWRSGDPVLRDPVSIPGQLLSVAQADAQGAVVLTHSEQRIGTRGPTTRAIQACAYDGVSAWQLDSYISATPFGGVSATDGIRIYLACDSSAKKGVVGIGYNSATGRLGQINSWSMAEAPTLLHVSHGHLLASSFGNLEVASISLTGLLTPAASYDTPVNLQLRVDRATFTPGLDVWVPAGDYGVEFLQRSQLAP